jgi:hypothetical protein
MPIEKAILKLFGKILLKFNLLLCRLIAAF